MFEVTAVCKSHVCQHHEFQVLRRNVHRRSTSGQTYTIEKVVCPKCSMWADVEKIKEVASYKKEGE